MKRRYLVLVVIAGLLVAGVAFAEGQSESETLDDQWETISVTGKISFSDWPMPEITSGGKTYELMVPRFAVDDVDVEAGDTITVEGILVDGRFDDDDQMLMVLKAVINGEEYEIPRGRASMGRMGMQDNRFDDDDDWYRGRGMDDRSGGRGGRRF